MTETAIHVGAHKTATTFVQSVLEKNCELLRENGVDYVIARRVRLRRHFNGKAVLDDDEIVRCLSPAVSDGTRLTIFSDEDAFGVARISHPVEIYRDADYVLDRLEKAVASLGNARVLFAVRDYADFIPSIYQQEVKRRRVGTPFRTYIADRVMLDEISWLPLLEKLSARFGDRLFVWTHEFFRDHSDAVLRDGFGLGALHDALTFPQRRTNTSLSEVGLDIMRSAYGRVSSDVGRELERFVSVKLKKRSNLPGEAYWASHEAKALSARYDRDLAAAVGMVATCGGCLLRHTPAAGL